MSESPKIIQFLVVVSSRCVFRSSEDELLEIALNDHVLY